MASETAAYHMTMIPSSTRSTRAEIQGAAEQPHFAGVRVNTLATGNSLARSGRRLIPLPQKRITLFNRSRHSQKISYNPNGRKGIRAASSCVPRSWASRRNHRPAELQRPTGQRV